MQHGCNKLIKIFFVAMITIITFEILKHFYNQLKLRKMSDKFKVEHKGNTLVITIPIDKKESKSGKSMTIATTGGNIPAGVEIDDKQLMIGINAYIPKK
jgi:hypothetical protein